MERYVGRFAPSPSGPLHFGSLLSALTSYLDARSCAGTWLLRIEDIDPPREQPGAALAIMQTLECHGMHWCGEAIYQRTRFAQHSAALRQLLDRQQAYYCRCTKKSLKHFNGGYPGVCKDLGLAPSQALSVRLKVPPIPAVFDDRLWGQKQSSGECKMDDFIIWRKGSLPAYQLAAVVDDALDDVNSVVRGADLIESSLRQFYLHQALGLQPPLYLHHPVLVDNDGNKLSKQARSSQVDNNTALDNLKQCLALLNQPIPRTQRISALLESAALSWRPELLPKTQTLPSPPSWQASKPIGQIL